MNNQPLTREELLEEIYALRAMLQPANSTAVPGVAITNALSRIDNVLNKEHPPVPIEEYVPPRPMNLRAISSDTLVTLTWDSIVDPAIVGFQILRREIGIDPVGQFTIIEHNTRNTSSTYIDTAVVLGGSYAYRVKSVDHYSILSEWSGYARSDLPLPSPRVEVEYEHADTPSDAPEPQHETPSAPQRQSFRSHTPGFSFARVEESPTPHVEHDAHVDTQPPPYDPISPPGPPPVPVDADEIPPPAPPHKKHRPPAVRTTPPPVPVDADEIPPPPPPPLFHGKAHRNPAPAPVHSQVVQARTNVSLTSADYHPIC